MRPLGSMTLWLTRLSVLLTMLLTVLLTVLLTARFSPLPGQRPRASGEKERGDVPGWVLVTVMSAGIVVALGAVAKDELTSILRDALNSVK